MTYKLNTIMQKCTQYKIEKSILKFKKMKFLRTLIISLTCVKFVKFSFMKFAEHLFSSTT